MTEVSLTIDHIRVGSLTLVCASSIWFVFVFVFDFRFVEQGGLTLCVCVSSVLAWDTLTPPPHCVHTPLSQHRTIILFFFCSSFSAVMSDPWPMIRMTWLDQKIFNRPSLISWMLNLCPDILLRMAKIELAYWPPSLLRMAKIELAYWPP